MFRGWKEAVGDSTFDDLSLNVSGKNKNKGSRVRSEDRAANYSTRRRRQWGTVCVVQHALMMPDLVKKYNIFNPSNSVKYQTFPKLQI